MYKIECKKEFQMPLQVLSYAERYNCLTKKNKKKKVIYIKNEFDNSTFRYRCYNFKEALINSKEFDISYFMCSETPKIIEYVDKMDIIIFQRTSWTIEVENLIYMAKLKKKPLVYDMDDLLYKIDYVPSFINHIGVGFTKETIPLYFSIASQYELVAKKCNYYITTTDFLKQKIENDFHKPTYVIPNFLNNEQIVESKEIMKKRKEDKTKFTIGYFSGSPSHKHDFHIVENDLILLLDKYENIYLKIVGFMPLEGKLKDYLNQGRVIFKELVPYPELQYEIGRVDVNIIPLVKNSFNQAKSELKYFEAGILKVPSCITKTDLYTSFVKDNKNGIFCEEGQWFNALEKLYLNPNLKEEIGESAYETTVKLYLPEVQKERIEKTYQDILKNSQKKESSNLK